eukprot:COSAG01_NODE_289_length_19391_cov_119.323122_20_plen_188_part_00
MRIREGQWCSRRTARGNVLLRRAPPWLLCDSSTRAPSALPGPPSVPLAACPTAPMSSQTVEALRHKGWKEVLALEWTLAKSAGGGVKPLCFDLQLGFVVGEWLEVSDEDQLVMQRCSGDDRSEDPSQGAATQGDDVYVAYVQPPAPQGAARLLAPNVFYARVRALNELGWGGWRESYQIKGLQELGL